LARYYYLSITSITVIIMRVTSKGQVTIPQNVRESMGILPAETEIEFLQDENGRWYIAKAKSPAKKASRFRTAHKTAKLTMSTDDIMALTRGG
jgi:AbrB family looped-hinge helix DNA binding protein